MWRVSLCTIDLQRRALVQVLSRSGHVDGEHALPKGGPTCLNALGGREVESRLDYILLPATRLQKVTHCFVFRKGRRLQLILHRHPRDHWPLMIRAKLELLHGGRSHNGSARCGGMGFDAIMLGLRDPDRRQSLLKEVEKWSSTHADTILEITA